VLLKKETKERKYRIVVSQWCDLKSGKAATAWLMEHRHRRGGWRGNHGRSIYREEGGRWVRRWGVHWQKEEGKSAGGGGNCADGAANDALSYSAEDLNDIAALSETRPVKSVPS
jgi:hypothetical protein